MEKFNENLKIFLISILIAGWGVDCSPCFANFLGLKGDVPPVPPNAATGDKPKCSWFKSNTSNKGLMGFGT